VLKAFIDDSGSDGNSPWYVLAGYVGTVEGWDLFDSLWAQAMHLHPRIEYFKATEAESLKGQFSCLSKDQRNEKIDALIRVIGRCGRRAVCSRMRRSHYNELVRGNVPEAWDSPYYFLFPAVIAACINIERLNGNLETVDFVFDDDSGHKKGVKRLLPSLFPMECMYGSMVNVVRKNDSEFIPLQAADLVAWQIRRHFSVLDEPSRQHYTDSRWSLPEEPHEFIIGRAMVKQIIDEIRERATQLGPLIARSPDVRTWR
jgi:hypothetical protein